MTMKKLVFDLSRGIHPTPVLSDMTAEEEAEHEAANAVNRQRRAEREAAAEAERTRIARMERENEALKQVLIEKGIIVARDLDTAVK